MEIKVQTLADFLKDAQLTCQKCGHRWIRRMERFPVRCPKCQSVKWQTQK